MKKLFFTLAFTLTMFLGYAQTVIADETTLTELKANIKVETSNEAIFSALLRDFKDELTKYTVSFKKDRTGAYKLYTIPFKREQSEKLKQFFRNLNKAK